VVEFRLEGEGRSEIEISQKSEKDVVADKRESSEHSK
jgi:hypothetical protein